MARKPLHTTFDEDLQKQLKVLAMMMNCNVNDLLEEGARLIISKNKDELIKYIEKI